MTEIEISTLKFVDELPKTVRSRRRTKKEMAEARDTESNAKKSKSEKIFDALKANQGKWAEYRSFPTEKRLNAYVFASSVKANRYKFLAANKGVEATVRTIDGEVKLYLRWVG